MKKILVIGGGITGLALAHAAAPRSECTLIEADGRLGGKILTVREGPFTLEAGPDSFLTAKPAAWQLCEELGLGSRLVDTRPEFNRTYVARGGRLHELPGGMASFVPKRWWPFITTRLLSPLAKLRMGLEALVPRNVEGDPSLEEFFTRRLGNEAYEWLVEPLLAGIYAARGRDLGLRSTFPRFLELVKKHGSLLRASLVPAPQASRGMFQSLDGGLGVLVEALRCAVEARATVRLGVGASCIRLHPDGVQVALSDGSEWSGDAVALCVPAAAAARLLRPLDGEVAKQLDGIRHSSTVTVSMAVPATEVRRPLDGYGFVVPRAEGRPTLACTWTSQKWPGRAPSEWRLLRSFLGGSGRAHVVDLPDDMLIEEATRDLSMLLGSPVRPRHTWVHRWRDGIPEYAPGHLDRVAGIERRVAGFDGRLVLAGATYHGVGIPDCIADGRAAAERLLDGRGQPQLREAAGMSLQRPQK